MVLLFLIGKGIKSPSAWLTFKLLGFMTLIGASPVAMDLAAYLPTLRLLIEGSFFLLIEVNILVTPWGDAFVSCRTFDFDCEIIDPNTRSVYDGVVPCFVVSGRLKL